MKGITTLASLPGSGSGSMSALPVEVGRRRVKEAGPDLGQTFIQFWLLGDERPTRIADQAALARRIAIANRKARNA